MVKKDLELARLYVALKPLATQPECATCRKCEEHVGLVYLVRGESAQLDAVDVPLDQLVNGVPAQTRSALAAVQRLLGTPQWL